MSNILTSIKESAVSHLFLIITFFISGILINIVQFFLYFGIRPFSKYLFRKLNYYVAYSLYSQLVFMAEWWANTDLIIYIDKEEFDKYYGKEHGFLFMNHRYEIDWLMGWVFCDRIRMLGNCKTYAKKEIQYVPTMGWAWKFGESVFLERNYQKDKEVIGRQIQELVQYPDCMWLLLMAEGTRFTAEKHEASKKFATEKGLPVLKHHLTPRTKGFTSSVPYLKGKVGAVYDVQLAFKKNSLEPPTVTTLLMGRGVEAHLYIGRIPMEEVPDGEEESVQWVHDLFQKKDRMTDSFFNTGDFFAENNEKRVIPFRLPRRYSSLINTLCWAFVVLVPMGYLLVCLLTSGSTIQFSIGVAIIALFYFLKYKLINMTKISKASSYGTKVSSNHNSVNHSKTD